MASEDYLNSQEAYYSCGFFGNRRGCSVDIGGSLIKVVTLQPKDDDTDTLLQSTFPRHELDQAISFIKAKCGEYIKGKTLYTTGVGCHQYKDKICSDLEVRDIDNFSENDCFVIAFQHLIKNRPLEELVHPSSKVAEKYAAKRFQEMMAMISKMGSKFGSKQQSDIGKGGPPPGVMGSGGPPPGVMGSGGPPPGVLGSGGPPPGVIGSGGPLPGVMGSSGPPPGVMGSDRPPPGVMGQGSPPSGAMESTSKKDCLFPCHLAMIGSGTQILQVAEDGPFKMADGCTRGGRTFLSLGSLMTGVKSYDELISLAEKGDNMALDMGPRHLKTGDEGDIYSILPDDMVLYSFGQAMGKNLSDFRKEDLCRTILDTICLENVEIAHLTTALAGVKHIFFCGSFASSSQLVRDIISIHMMRRQQSKPMYKMAFHFLKNGSHLGAMGAMMRGFEKEGTVAEQGGKHN